MYVFHLDINSKRLNLLIQKIENLDPFEIEDVVILNHIYSLIEDVSKKLIFILKLNKIVDVSLKEKLRESLLNKLWQETDYGYRTPIKSFFQTYSNIPLELNNAFLDSGFIYLTKPFFKGKLLLLYFETFKQVYVDITKDALESLEELIELKPLKKLEATSPFQSFQTFSKKQVKIKKLGEGTIPENDFPHYIQRILTLLREDSKELKHHHWFFIVRYLLNAGYNEKEVHNFLKESPKYTKAIAEPQVKYIVIKEYGPPSLTELKTFGLITDEEAINEKNLFPHLKRK